MGIFLKGDNETKLNSSLLPSLLRSHQEIHLATWSQFFNKGNGSRSEVVVEAFLLYWLLCYELTSGPEDGLNLHLPTGHFDR